MYVYTWSAVNHLFLIPVFGDNDCHIPYSDLRNLPGANGKDWGDEADSLKVGSAATVKAYKEENFKGTSVTYNPGTQESKLSEEPSSLDIACK